jgi:hypothetical protein
LWFIDGIVSAIVPGVIVSLPIMSYRLPLRTHGDDLAGCDVPPVRSAAPLPLRTTLGSRRRTAGARMRHFDA